MLRALGAVVLLAVLLTVSVSPVGGAAPGLARPLPPPGPSLSSGPASFSGSPRPAAESAPFFPGSPALLLPPSPSTNVLVDVPCNVSGNAEVQQAFDPGLGYLYETWIGCGGIGFSRSTDGGHTFDAAVTVPGSAPPSGGSWDPSIAVSPNGTVYVAFMVSVPGDTPAVAWSWDHGLTFAGNATVFAPPGNSFSDRDFLAIAPNGTLYVTWDFSPMFYWTNGTPLDVIGCAYGGSCYFTNGDYNIVIASSSDGGRSWSPFTPVDPEYPWGGAPCGPVEVAPNGTVEVLLEDYGISGWDHALGLGYNYFTTSSNGGLDWSSPVRLANLSFPDTDWWINGAITRDRSGTLYATFDAVNGTNDTAWVAVSRDGGSTWPVVQAINPDVDTAAHVMATGAGGENGTVYLAWMSDESGNWSTYERPLAGNGTRFGPTTVVSDQPGLPGYWIGDTIGLSYLGSGSVAVSWSYGVTQASLTASQVFEALVPEALPGPVASLSIEPGHGNATVRWTPPTGTEPVTSYRVDWGVEGNLSDHTTVPASNLSLPLASLLPFTRYQVQVTATDAAGSGPTVGPVNFTLTAWSLFGGQVSPAWATVTIDGQPVGTTAGTYLANETYAPHLLAVRAVDYQGQATAVLPSWNGTTFTNVSLSLLPGVIQGYLSPTTALLTWQGSPVAVSALGFYALSVAAGSTGTLFASLPLFLPQSRTVTVTANSTVWTNLTLVPSNGTLALTVHPVNASVEVASSPVALDPSGNATVLLPPGTVAVEVAAPGYVTEFYNVTILSENVTPLAVQLKEVHRTLPSNGTSPSPFWAILGDPTLVVLLLAVLLIAVIAVLWVRRRPPPDAGVERGGGAPAFEDTEGVEVLPPEGPAEPPG